MKDFNFVWYGEPGDLFGKRGPTLEVEDLEQLATMINEKYHTSIQASDIIIGEPHSPVVNSPEQYRAVGFGAGLVGWVVEERALPAYTKFSRDEVMAKELMWRNEIYRQGLGEHSGASQLFESILNYMGEMFKEINRLKERGENDNV